MSGNNPDFFRITREDRSSIGINTIRDRLVRDIRIQPYQSAYKVYLIEEADTMTVEAQNALLKTLEEPPSYVLIILTANSSQVFLPTVLSRVISLRFQPLSDSLIAEQLVREGHVSAEKAAVTAALSRGSLGEARKLVSSEEFTALRDELTQNLSTISQKKPSEILQMAGLFDRYKDSKETLFSLMQIWFRDLILLKTTGQEDSVYTKDQLPALKKLAYEYTMDDLQALFSAVLEIREQIRLGAQYAFAVDCLLMKFIRLV